MANKLQQERSQRITHSVEAELAGLVAKYDLSFGDCVRYFSERQNPVEKQYAQYAHENMNDEGTSEVDANAVVSMGADRGAYVMAWVWVDADAAGVSSYDQAVAQLEAGVDPN